MACSVLHNEEPLAAQIAVRTRDRGFQCSGGMGDANYVAWAGSSAGAAPIGVCWSVPRQARPSISRSSCSASCAVLFCLSTSLAPNAPSLGTWTSPPSATELPRLGTKEDCARGPGLSYWTRRAAFGSTFFEASRAWRARAHRAVQRVCVMADLSYSRPGTRCDPCGLTVDRSYRDISRPFDCTTQARRHTWSRILIFPPTPT